MKINRKTIALLLLICLSFIGSGCQNFKSRKSKTLNQLLKSGNEAFYAQQYDKAIEFYNAGLTLSPKEPTFLTNKSIALLRRTAERYNESIKLNDEKAKAEGIENAKSDFLIAAELSNESVKIIKSRAIFDLFESESSENFKLNAFSGRADCLRVLSKVVDQTRVNEAVEAAHEYIELEPNREKKIKALLDTGKLLIETGNGEKAIIEYKKVSDSDEENIEALLGIGLALAQSGEKDKFEESKIYLRKFVDKAPATHPSLGIANEILNTKPQK